MNWGTRELVSRADIAVCVAEFSEAHSLTGGTMERAHEQALNDLLARWHRWCHAPVRVSDTRLQDFDSAIRTLSVAWQSALATQARNLSGGVAVWSSYRAQDVEGARHALHAQLQGDPDRWFGRRILYLNERGNRIGESNPRADLSDQDVQLLLELREERKEDGSHRYSYSWLAQKFECAKSTVSDICSGRRRCQLPARVKEV